MAEAGVACSVDDDGVESPGTGAEPVGVGGGVAEAKGSAIAGVPFKPTIAGVVDTEVSTGVRDLEVTLAVVGGCGSVGGGDILVFGARVECLLIICLPWVKE